MSCGVGRTAQFPVCPKLTVLLVCPSSTSQNRSEAFGRKKYMQTVSVLSFQSIPPPLTPIHTSPSGREIMASGSLGLSGKKATLAESPRPGGVLRGCGLRCAPFNMMVGSRPRKVVLI